MKSGTVYLVGAGPGHEDLLTLKADRIIREADVIIHNALIGDRILARAKLGAELIRVGKRGGQPSTSQDDINGLLVEKASQGLMVARLKGGDPFLFGRGAEEAQALLKEGIAFQIVPGITSASAASAYAGIPMTHREKASAVTILTAHQAEGGLGVDIGAVAKSGATLVVLMGMANLESWLAQWSEQGLDPESPAAAISWASTIRERTVISTVAKLAMDCARRGLSAPGVVIIGEVAELGRTLAWYEALPLFGKRALVVQSSRREKGLRGRLMDLGAEVVSFPVIETEILPLDPDRDRLFHEVGSHDMVLFTSPEGVRVFFEIVRDKGLDSRLLESTQVGSIGPGTSAELEKVGIRSNVVAQGIHSAEGLLESLGDMKGKSILIPRAEQARAFLTEGLEAQGARVEVLALYRTGLPKQTRPEAVDEVKGLLESGGLDVALLTSGSSVLNLVKILGNDSVRLLSKTQLVTLGPVTSKVVEGQGLRVAGQAKEASIPALVDAVQLLLTDHA